MALLSPCLSSTNEKKHWWLSNRKIVDKYLREARNLIATQEKSDVVSALSLIESALALSPRLEQALELKARSLLFLRRFKDIADMLQDYIPSLKMSADESENSSTSSSSSSSASSSSSHGLSRERVKLLDSEGTESSNSFTCFSVSDLKKKLMAGLGKNGDGEGQWRYLVLGQACCHLGLMEDAMALLQTGKRLATAAFRRESVCWSDDSFSLSDTASPSRAATISTSPPRAAATALSDADNISHLLSHLKFLLRRRTAAVAALDAGLYSEAIRHFTKLLDSRRASSSAPLPFLAECYLRRAAAFRSSGRIAESIADCNRTLALDPSSIDALETRASLFESIRCLPDSLHDLEHLKLLYNSILRDRRLPGPAWKRHRVRYREIPGKLCALAVKIQELKSRLANGESTRDNVDYYALIGLRRGCSRSELEMAHRLLLLRHKPDKSTAFIERCENGGDDDHRDLDEVRDRAKMSALVLYRLIQKGHSILTAAIMEDAAAAEKQRQCKKVAVVPTEASQIPIPPIKKSPEMEFPPSVKTTSSVSCGNNNSNNNSNGNGSGNNGNVFQGVFCRDLAVVGNLLSQVGFNRPITVKYEALTC